MNPALRYKWPRAAHGEIVDGAVDGEIADRPAGKNQRAHDKRISRKGQPRTIDRQNRAVVPLFEHGIAERGHKNLFDELMGQPSAAAVRQDDAIVSDSGYRTTQVEFGHDCHVCRLP